MLKPMFFLVYVSVETFGLMLKPGFKHILYVI